MSGRERKMAVVLVVIAGGYVFWQFVRPKVREYVLGIRDENELLQAEADELDRQLGDVNAVRRTFREYAERTGGTNADEFKNTFYNKLTEMAKEAGFGDLRMQPSPTEQYKPAGWRSKSNIKEVRFTISADGTLASAVGFLKAFYELPYITQITSLKIESAGRRSRRGGDQVQLRATIEALVPPNDPVGQVNVGRITPATMKVKHDDRDYALIWERNPFKEYIEPPKFAERAPVTPVHQEDPEPEKAPIGDPQAHNKMIKMAMIYGDPEDPTGELLVFNTRDLSSEYVGVGDQLDGGEVRLVHPWGAVTRREDGQERVYPIRKTLAESKPVEDAAPEYPEIAYAYQLLRESEPAEELSEEFVGPEVPDANSPDGEPAPYHVPVPFAYPPEAGKASGIGGVGESDRKMDGAADRMERFRRALPDLTSPKTRPSRPIRGPATAGPKAAEPASGTDNEGERSDRQASEGKAER